MSLGGFGTFFLLLVKVVLLERNGSFESLVRLLGVNMVHVGALFGQHLEDSLLQSIGSKCSIR